MTAQISGLRGRQPRPLIMSDVWARADFAFKSFFKKKCELMKSRNKDVSDSMRSASSAALLYMIFKYYISFYTQNTWHHLSRLVNLTCEHLC